jgi:hypothetical protein
MSEFPQAWVQGISLLIPIHSILNVVEVINGRYAHVTVVFPLLRAIKGFARKPDTAWFLHPMICIAFVSGYGLHVIKKYLR